jgi:cell division septation protein DedD
MSSVDLFALRVTPTRASPRARRPVTGTPSTPTPPTTRAVEDTVSRSPEPDELSPTGVSFESLRFGNRAR